MKTEDFQKLKDVVELELKLDENNIMDKSIQLSNLYAQFLKIYSKELRTLKDKLLEKDKVYGELFQHYRHGTDYENNKSEAEILIKSDPKYYQIALECAQIEVQVNFLEKVLTHIDNLGFRIKNYIDLVKIKKGLI